MVNEIFLYREKLGDADDADPNTSAPPEEHIFGIPHRRPGSGNFEARGISVQIDIEDAGGNDMVGTGDFTLWLQNPLNNKWYRVNTYSWNSKEAEFFIPVHSNLIYFQITNLPAGTSVTRIYMQVI